MFQRRILASLFFLMYVFSAFGQHKDFVFKHLTTSDGLSQNHGMAALQDHLGFIWLGTFNGLNKYNGYEISAYKKDIDDSTSLSDNTILCVFEDSDNNLWIGTRDGLNLYDRKLDRFKRFKNTPEKAGSVSNNSILAIFEDREKNLWIGTENGLNLYNKKDYTFTAFTDESHQSINSLFEDSFGNLWVGSYFPGLSLFDKKSKKFTTHNPISIRAIGEYQGVLLLGTNEHGLITFDIRKKAVVGTFTHNDSDEQSIGSNTIYTIFVDTEKNIWIGTENAGLNLFDPTHGTFTKYVNDINKKSSISNNSVSSIFEDKQGNIWAGVHRGGFNIFNLEKENFTTYQQEPGGKGLSNNNVKSFCQDKDGNLWIGTDGGGLNLFNTKTKRYTHFKHISKDPTSINGNVVMTLCEDSEGNIWAGTYAFGLDRYDKKKNRFYHYVSRPGDSTSIIGPGIWWVMEDKRKNLWIATRHGGLSLYNKKKDNFSTYLHDPSNPHSISDNTVYHIYEDSKDNLWIATRNGLNLLHRESSTFEHFFHEEGNKNSLSNNDVYTISEDLEGNLWIGTRDGLNLFDPKQGTWKTFGTAEGLPGTTIQSIIPDNGNNLWLGTQNGLVRFNYKRNKIKIYTEQDGLQGMEFTLNSAMKTREGEFFFGGNNGFNSFFPDSIKENTTPPPVYFTAFKIFNKTVELGPHSPLKENINQAKEITLNYDHSVFSFEFTALNLIKTEKNNFAYRMEGFDKEWIYVGNKRSATYTNLNPGKYIFRVKASNNDGYWNKNDTSITIIISPPFWHTWWFRALMVVLVVAVVFTWYRIRIHAIHQQKRLLEQQVKERTAEVMDQKEEILSQREELELLYKEVKDSIKAAQSIQESLLPNMEVIRQYLPESFVFYQPKDDVSGDFYWFDVIDNKIIIAVADCTGHGVSGAFMSINGYHLLNKVIFENKHLVASEILNQLNLSLIKEFKQKEHLDDIHNGMDIALCIIDIDTKKIQYAGANCPLYLIRNKEIMQIKSDRFPIGLLIGDRVGKFKNNEIQIKKGDVFYLFSDGYADQIGQGGEKFLYTRFRDLLVEISSNRMNEQSQYLADTFKNWKGNKDQLDDILVMGFKVD